MKNNIVIVGPSGSGKSTIAEMLINMGWSKIITCTTRDIRPGEKNGVDYYFLSKEEFDKIEKVEYTLYSNNYYGTTVKELQAQLNKDNCFSILDISGALKMKKRFPETKIIFVYSNLDTLKERMKKRGDSDKKIEERIQNIINSGELENQKYADFIIKNDSLEQSLESLKKIICQL